jgi:predicted dinucleotide-binding enzyme
MNIGLIGPGDIGEVIVRRLRDADYPVKMVNSRGPESQGRTSVVVKERRSLFTCHRPGEGVEGIFGRRGCGLPNAS